MTADKTSPSFFENIPPELKLKIFGNLKIKERGRISEVSKEIDLLSNDEVYWKSLLTPEAQAALTEGQSAKQIFLNDPKSRAQYVGFDQKGLDYLAGLIDKFFAEVRAELETSTESEAESRLKIQSDQLTETEKMQLITLFSDKTQVLIKENECTIKEAFEREKKEYFKYLDSFIGLSLLEKGFITYGQALLMPTAEHLKFLEYDWCEKPFEQGDITFQQLTIMPTGMHIVYLLMSQSIAALKEKLITLEEVAQIQNVKYVEYALSEGGIDCLKKEILTLAQMIQMPTELHLAYFIKHLTTFNPSLIKVSEAIRLPRPEYLIYLLLNKKGLRTLASGRIKPDETPELLLSPYYSTYFLVEGQENALSAHQITPEEAAQMPTAQHLRYFLIHLYALDENLDSPYKGLVTARGMASMPDIEYVEYFLVREGLDILRENLFTLEKISLL